MDVDGATWRAQLAAGAATLGVSLDAQALDRFWRLALALRERNQQVNLTAIDDLPGIRALHIFDSLSVVPHLGDAHRVLDVGTGGGFPGLPLAIVCPQVQFTLIDGTQKKIRFVAERDGARAARRELPPRGAVRRGRDPRGRAARPARAVLPPPGAARWADPRAEGPAARRRSRRAARAVAGRADSARRARSECGAAPGGAS
jgi:hypothetical protein